jgi:hypothetical protein
MPKRIDWLPYGRAERKSFLNVFAQQVVQYTSILGLTPAEVTRIQEIAAGYSYAVDQTELAKVFAKSMVAWRNHATDGKRPRKALPAVPVFNASPVPAGTTASLIYEIRKIVARIKVSPGYDIGVGTALNILPPNHVKKPLRELAPQLKVTAFHGFKVKIACEMEGMTAVQVEYRRNGEEKYEKVAFLTNLPETIYVEPRVMGVPESGYMRAVFIKKNKSVGEYSKMASVTLFGM